MSKLETEKNVLMNEAANLNKLIENLKDSNDELHRTKDELIIQLTAATNKVSDLSDQNKELMLIKNDCMHKIGTLNDSVSRRDESIHALQGITITYSRSQSSDHALTH